MTDATNENYNIDYDKAMRWNLLATMQGGGGGGTEYSAAAPITIDENNAIGLAYSSEDFAVNESGELVSVGGGTEYTAAAPITIDENNNIGLAIDETYFSIADNKLINSIFYIVNWNSEEINFMDAYNAFRTGKIVVLNISSSTARREYRIVQPYLNASGGRPYILEMYFITRNPDLQISIYRLNQNNEKLETVRINMPSMEQVYTRDELDTKFSEVEAYSFNDVKIVEFNNTVSGGTALPVTSDTPISGVSTGRVDINIPSEYATDYQLAGLTKFEVKNGDTRIDAIPMYEFTMEGQTVVRLGLRTSGRSPKNFDTIKGAMLLKRRTQ